MRHTCHDRPTLSEVREDCKNSRTRRSIALALEWVDKDCRKAALWTLLGVAVDAPGTLDGRLIMDVYGGNL